VAVDARIQGRQISGLNPAGQARRLSGARRHSIPTGSLPRLWLNPDPAFFCRLGQ